MAPEHAWAGEAHNLFDPVAHRRLIAMDRASAAGRFKMLERAGGKSMPGIGKKFAAFGAGPLGTVVMRAAIQGDHHLNGSSLPDHTGPVDRHRPLFLSCSMISTQTSSWFKASLVTVMSAYRK